MATPIQPSQFYGDRVQRENMMNAVPIQEDDDLFDVDPELPNLAEDPAVAAPPPVVDDGSTEFVEDELESEPELPDLGLQDQPQPQVQVENYPPELMRLPADTRQDLYGATALTFLASQPGASKELIEIARAKQQELEDRYLNGIYAEADRLSENQYTFDDDDDDEDQPDQGNQPSEIVGDSSITLPSQEEMRDTL